MIQLNCPNSGCKDRLRPIIVDCDKQAKLSGVLTCLKCGHDFPITIENGCVRELSPNLPGSQSKEISQKVPTDLQEDIEEAERANYHQCFKASVTMCRRALQLGLTDKGISDGRLSDMLNEALQQGLLEQKTYSLATTIKGYGDIGAHRRELLEPQEVNMVIHAAVKMLNELFK